LGFVPASVHSIAAATYIRALTAKPMEINHSCLLARQLPEK